MALVDGLASAAAHKDVLVVIGHAGDLMGHHLANRDNQIMPT